MKKEALEEVYRAYQAPVYNLGRRICGNEEDAEDVLQDTFLEVCRSIGKFRGDGSLWSWVRRVAVSKALMLLRRERHRAARSLDGDGGLAGMVGMDTLDIAGVTDGPDNDYVAQAEGALEALGEHDLVVTHIEAPDEAAHAGRIDDKIEAIEWVDRDVMGQLLASERDSLHILAMPDHATPVEVQTHTPDPVPFVLWGPGFQATGAKAFSEAQAKSTGILIEDGYTIMKEVIQS